jgi:hypothetical protein
MLKRFLKISLFLASSCFQASIAADAALSCGPSENLADEFSGNVDSNSRCFEIRMYTAAAATSDGVGGIENLHQRFREQEVSIFERLGAEVIAVWQRLDDPNTLVWMLAYRDGEHRDTVWEEFRSDPEWIALRAQYPVTLSAEVYMMSAADYSNLK